MTQGSTISALPPRFLLNIELGSSPNTAVMKGISLSTVRTSNATIKTLGPGLVAVFVGGTSGIGESILKAFVSVAAAPRVYIIGRNRDAANRIVKECRAVNEASEVEFLQADVSEIANVDQVCSDIMQREKMLNLLVLTTGILTVHGRNGTAPL